ncbi:GYF domain-containing protein [Gimesia sp.]|uniref:GYF domain-containing protein n=1 Tax=Gimesia sp. TaxID=2024833 RepID=UPI003A9387A3
MAQEWYYTKEGERQGPITSKQLKQLAVSGEIQPTDLVWTEGKDDWKPASIVKGLFPTKPDLPKPPPVPGSTNTAPALCGNRKSTLPLVFLTALIVLSLRGNITAQDVFQKWPRPSEVSVSTGRNQVIIPPGRGGVSYFPDEAICVLKDSPLTFTMVCGDSTYVWSGTSFTTAIPVGKVLSPGPAGSPDNHYAGIGGIFHNQKRNRVVGFYHAEDKEGIGKVKVNGVQGFYGAVCVGEVSENSRGFSKRGPCITADKPKVLRGWETEGGPPEAWNAQGVGEPTVCIDGAEEHLLCYYTEWSNRLKRGVQICVARSPIEKAGLPGSWIKFYKNSFSEPGLGGHDTPVISAGMQADTYTPHVQFVKQWNRYVMVFGMGVQSDIQSRPMKATQSGLYLTTSKDGVDWTKPVQIERVFAFVINTQECKIHPTLVVSRVSGKTLTGLLLYGYTPKWPGTPHHLGGCPIKISLDRDSTTTSTQPTTPKPLVDLESLRKIVKSEKVNAKGEIINLDLTGVSITESHLAAIGTLQSLQSLNLYKTNLTDDGLKALAKPSNLSYLAIGRTRITSDGLRHLTGLKKIKGLRINGNKGIGDSGVEHLTEMKKLTVLQINNTSISEAGIQKLKRALPNCKIIH